MMTVNSVESHLMMVKSLTGNQTLQVPCEGGMKTASVFEFEEQVRSLAYSFMVKGYRRDNIILVSGCSDALFNFIKTGCKLARLKAVRSEDISGADVDWTKVRALFVPSAHAVTLPVNNSADCFLVDSNDDSCSLDYLLMLGRTWCVKYRPFVDRVMLEYLYN